MPRAEMHWDYPRIPPLSTANQPCRTPHSPRSSARRVAEKQTGTPATVIEKLGGSAPSIAHIPGPTDDAEPAG